MLFRVQLIEVAPLEQLTGVEVFRLMTNASHIAGNFWIYEGELFGLGVASAVVRAEGVTEGTGCMGDGTLTSHCEEIFGVDLSGEDPAWKMCGEHGVVS